MHALGRKRRHGFTLLEVMIAAALLVVAIVGSIALIVGLLRGNQTTRARDSAFFLAQQTLDQLDSLPLSQWGPLAQASPTNATCYTEGDDQFMDRPIQCLVGATEASYWVRSWICCAAANGLPTGTSDGLWVAPNTPVIPAPYICGGAGWQFPTTVGMNTQTLPATSATCTAAVEVTWPFEPAGSGFNGTNLFVDSATLPALTFQNHILLSTVRSQ